MAQAFRRIAITSKPSREEGEKFVRELVEWLEERGCELVLDATTASAAGRRTDLKREEVSRGADLLVVLGGDGTFLSAARTLGADGPPILGINLGRLGFLTALPQPALFPSLERILAGDYLLEERQRLRPALHRGGEVIPLRDVLNDVVITPISLARLVELTTRVNGRHLATFRADGLILSTPTGSTAYALAASGPIMVPRVQALILCPICPHNLSNRPIVLPDDVAVQIALRERDTPHVLLTLDGQEGHTLEPGDVVEVAKSPHPVRLVHPPDSDFFQLLREKLGWEVKPLAMDLPQEADRAAPAADC
ncbi:MAG: NAD(+)/NADH kinase [Nitrospinota bacterium]